MRPEALHLTDVKQWRKALLAGALTNAVRGGKAKSKRPMSPAKDASSAAAMEDPPKKILRAALYSSDPNGQVPWPPSRLRCPRAMGWHKKGSRSTYCDYPLCALVSKTATSAADDSEGVSAPGGSSAASSRCPSPAPSNASSSWSTGLARGGVTKLYCLDCYDPSNTRPMNFHAECWNLWHGLRHGPGNPEPACATCP